MTDRVLTEGGISWLHVIDLHLQDAPGVVGAFLLVGNRELALLETGPSTGRAALEAGIHAAGYELADVTRLIVTHIHLDHAGGAGTIMRDVPNARLSVHSIGAPHMVDPTRLLSSATRIYGEKMQELWGDVVGIDADRVDILEDNQVLEVAGRRLRALDTPGHASHHLAILDEGSGTLFTGDVGSVRLEDTRWVCSATPPPELNLTAWAESVEKMRSVRAERLALTHFGFVDDVDEHLDQIMPNLEDLVDLAKQELLAGGSPEDLTNRISQHNALNLGVSVDDPLIRRLDVANPAYMCTMGLERFLRKRGDLDGLTTA